MKKVCVSNTLVNSVAIEDQKVFISMEDATSIIDVFVKGMDYFDPMAFLSIWSNSFDQILIETYDEYHEPIEGRFRVSKSIVQKLSLLEALSG